MSTALTAAVAIPSLISRYIYKDHQIKFTFHHGRTWQRREVAYILLAGVLAYLLIPFYLKNTGAYLNWPSASDADSIIRSF